MKTFAISVITSICITTALSWPQTSVAQPVPLVFQTTFACNDWNQSMGGSDSAVCGNGDGIEGYGNWTADGTADQITAAANHPGGGGGKGFRHYRANGTNVNGGGLLITLPANVTEMWVRFYMRYSLGFAWATPGKPTYTKEHYWSVGESDYVIFGIQGSNSWGMHYGGTGSNHPSSLSWIASQGGNTGDGQWHLYEYHVRVNGTASTIEVWVDGVRVLNNTSANLGNSPLRYFALGSNQSSVTGCNPPCYTDYDDIAISTVGRIGPIGILPPRNLKVQ